MTGEHIKATERRQEEPLEQETLPQAFLSATCAGGARRRGLGSAVHG